MSQQELLTVVTQTLTNLGIEYMLSGSHASSLQGEARATHDIDLVVRLSLNDVEPLFLAFQDERFYLSKSAMTDAIQICKRGLTNLTSGICGNEFSMKLSRSFPPEASKS